MKQQTLALKLPQEKTFENFYGKAREQIIFELQHFSSGNMYLWGNRGAGISHLLQATCLYWQKKNSYSIYLDLSEKPDLATLLQGALEGIQLIALDHLEAFLGDKKREEALFHLFNRSVQTPFHLIFGAKTPPENLRGVLKDLSSRLTTTLIFHVQDLNDHEKKEVLISFAAQRGLELPEEVALFMMNHFPRELPQLIQLIEKLDRASLQAQRKLTIPFVKTCIFAEHSIC